MWDNSIDGNGLSLDYDSEFLDVVFDVGFFRSHCNDDNTDVHQDLDDDIDELPF